MTDTELKKRLADFMDHFELVFRDDWDFTRDILKDDAEHYISADGSFLEPRVSDESNNWGNRGSLLASYRELVEAMKAQGIYVSTR